MITACLQLLHAANAAIPARLEHHKGLLCGRMCLCSPVHVRLSGLILCLGCDKHKFFSHQWLMAAHTATSCKILTSIVPARIVLLEGLLCRSQRVLYSVATHSFAKKHFGDGKH